jgi:hypothetical protein
MGFNTIGITRPSAGLAHPFKVDISKIGKNPDGKPIYGLAVNFHSFLYSGMTQKGNFFKFTRVAIREFSESGLDFVKPVPPTFPGQNFYCVLEVDISNLRPVGQARIVWISSDTSEEALAPILFESGSNLRQTKARAIIGVLVADDEAIAGTPGGAENKVNTAYFIQYINTHLIMCNMVFDGVAVIYPVPFVGGRLNEQFF